MNLVWTSSKVSVGISRPFPLLVWKSWKASTWLWSSVKYRIDSLKLESTQSLAYLLFVDFVTTLLICKYIMRAYTRSLLDLRLGFCMYIHAWIRTQRRDITDYIVWDSNDSEIGGWCRGVFIQWRLKICTWIIRIESGSIRGRDVILFSFRCW